MSLDTIKSNLLESLRFSHELGCEFVPSSAAEAALLRIMARRGEVTYRHSASGIMIAKLVACDACGEPGPTIDGLCDECWEAEHVREDPCGDCRRTGEDCTGCPRPADACRFNSWRSDSDAHRPHPEIHPRTWVARLR